MLASQYQSSDWNQHTNNQSSICWRNLLAPGTMHEKSSSKPIRSALFFQRCYDSRSWDNAGGPETSDEDDLRLSQAKREFSL